MSVSMLEVGGRVKYSMGGHPVVHTVSSKHCCLVSLLTELDPWGRQTHRRTYAEIRIHEVTMKDF